MIGITNIDLLIVGLSVASTGILGFVIYFNNRKSSTAFYFLLFSLLTILWGASNYANYQLTSLVSTSSILWVLRIHLFISVWHALTFFTLAYVFPSNDRVILPPYYKKFIFPAALITSILTLTPLVFIRIDEITSTLEVVNPERGPGIALFGAVSFGLIFWGLGLLIKKTFKATKEEKLPFEVVVMGAVITFALIILVNLVLPVVFDVLDFIPLGAVFLLPFVFLTGYSIIRHHFLNVKFIATDLLTFSVITISFFEILLSQTAGEIIFRITLFVVLLSFGIFLIRSVRREVETKEALAVANTQQTNLIRFISHEVKGALGKSRGFSSLIADGNFGEVAPKLKEMSADVFKTTTKGVEMVEDILNASNIRKGTFSYDKKAFDFKNMVTSIAEGFRATAEGKGLAFAVHVPEGDYQFTGDEKQLSHIVKNLVDNSVRYTTTGSVTVLLEKGSNLIRFKVTDTGFGLSDEDKKNLFTEGGKGKESQKVNVESTGYGLYIVKGIVEAHGGKVWADSPGRSHGSSFIVELPVVNTPTPAPVLAPNPTSANPVPEQKV